MKWWKKALIGTGILLVVVAGFAFVSYQQILKTSANAQITDARNDKLGTLCGEITGAGMVVIWVVAYRRRNKQ
jgi:uncharacterized YccA/Bax inhibitor family protein